MTKNKYLIVGGVAGGATTAARLRRIDEESEIIIFEKGAHISYANCGLPYYIGNVITERENLLLQTPQSFYDRFNIEVRVHNEVIAIDKEHNRIKVRDLVSGKEYTEDYTKLILSPGASPVKPPIPGIEHPSIFTLRNVTDTDTIKNYINTHKPKRAVVVGAGFIGLEMAENLHHLGMEVTIVEAAEQVMTFLDYDMAAQVHQHLKINNVQFYLKDAVSHFNSNKGNLSVNLSSGKIVDTDMIILSIGVRPENKLALEAGLELGERNGIIVNEYLQTSNKDIYALGDAIEFNNPILNKNTLAFLAGPANKQGRIVANNLTYGNKEKYTGSISTAIAKIFDITVASCGVSQNILNKENIKHESTIVHGASHAGYYPNPTPLSLKLTFDPETGKILGAQSVGYEGVDKRIDVIATVIKLGGTIYDLKEIEHAYAPPFSSAKDPVNIAGFTAENIINKSMNIFHWNDIEKIDYSNSVLIDVRTQEEFELGAIKNAINIPVDGLRHKLNEIPKNKKIYIYCAVGLRGYVATRVFMQLGYKHVYNLSGGYKIYELATQKQSNEDIFDNVGIGKDNTLYNKAIDQKESFLKNIIEVDACGLQCPGPIIKLKEEIEKINIGEQIKEISSDPGFYKDVQSWCTITGNKLINVERDKNKIVAIVEKAEKKPTNNTLINKADNKTIVVFSEDLDKALASFVIATGAAAMGKKVTMFFTFWGISILKRKHKPKVKKDIMGRMFGGMLPSSSEKLKLSKMNMMNIGRAMMKMRMKSKNIDSLEMMIQKAQDAGVEFLACNMSMDLMGIDQKELIDGVKIGGVATYLEESEKSNLNLFI